MEWTNNYWYIFLLCLVAVIFFFGYRAKKNTEKMIQDDHQHGSDTGDKAHKSGHGCCH